MESRVENYRRRKSHWTRRFRYGALYYAILALRWLAARFPLSLSRRIGAGGGFLAGYVLFRHRRRALRNLRLAYGGAMPAAERRRVINAVSRNLGRSFVEAMFLLSGRTESLLASCRVEGWERLAPHLESGKGVIGLTAHYGNWEILPLFLARHMDCDFGSVGRPQSHGRLNELVRRLRENAGARVFERGNSGRDYIRFVREGNFLGLLGDLDTLSGDGFFIDYFGRPAWTQRGIADLAWLARAPIAPIFIERDPADPSRHIVHCMPVIEAPNGAGVGREKWVLDATRQFTRAIEEQVRARPDLWIWMHNRWKHRPEDPERLRKRRMRHAERRALTLESDNRHG